MIKVATIVPTNLLHFTNQDTYLMSLAQLIGTDERYTLFFQRKLSEGCFVLMDNGAAEGEAPTAEELIKKIEILHPSEVIIPDTIYEKEETLAKGEEAIDTWLDYYGYIPFDMMAVPQGETPEEWLECAEEMLEWPIKSIGISKFVTPKYAEAFGGEVNVRTQLVKAFRELEIKFGQEPKEIHLLGCWGDPREIGSVPAEYNVRGCDSAIAYVYTRAGIVFDADVERPEGEIDFINGTLDDQFRGLMTDNIIRWRGYSNGQL